MRLSSGNIRVTGLRFHIFHPLAYLLKYGSISLLGERNSWGILSASCKPQAPGQQHAGPVADSLGDIQQFFRAEIYPGQVVYRMGLVIPFRASFMEHWLQRWCDSEANQDMFSSK